MFHPSSEIVEHFGEIAIRGLTGGVIGGFADNSLNLSSIENKYEESLPHHSINDYMYRTGCRILRRILQTEDPASNWCIGRVSCSGRADYGRPNRDAVYHEKYGEGVIDRLI